MSNESRTDRRSAFAGLCAVALLLAAEPGCRQDMADQPRNDPLEVSDFFADGRASRPLVPGTVARGQLRDDPHFFTGKIDGQFATRFPDRVRLDRELLLTGQAKFNIYCSPCHGPRGEGNGMIVQRGFRRPNSYHQDRLRAAPPGYYFDVITHGYGTMYDQADRVSPAERWAIVAYIRALQFSHDATWADVPPEARDRMGTLEGGVYSLPSRIGRSTATHDERREQP